jgi:hypothetical protein
MKVSRARVGLGWVVVLVVERGGCVRGSLAGRDAGEIGSGWEDQLALGVRERRRVATVVAVGVARR